jgi:pantetheine-phosphate adenylyltransferase
MIKALYAGSFDPVTLGHADIIKIASQDFDEVYVTLMRNPQKSLARAEERYDWLKKTVSWLGLKNVTVRSYLDSGRLAADIARGLDVSVLIRGIKGVNNMEEELQLAFNNSILFPEAHTIWVPVSEQHYHVSSTAVRTILQCMRDPEENQLLRTRLISYLPLCIIDDVINSRVYL